MKSFNKLDLELVASIARYHRKAHPSQKHLHFNQLSPTNQDVVRKLSSLLRVADALDFRRAQRVESVSCAVKPKILTISIASPESIQEEIAWAAKKARLIQEVFNTEVQIQKSNSNRRP
jgi:exopolyphosphatase/guanosine-5'-triphosphate,3'-diphosphate pyrophosphatase